MNTSRLIRGTRKDPVQVSFTVASEAREIFASAAKHAGMSKAVFFEVLMEHIEENLTDRGVPNWMPQPEPDVNELPMRLSA